VLQRLQERPDTTAAHHSTISAAVPRTRNVPSNMQTEVREIRARGCERRRESIWLEEAVGQGMECAARLVIC